MDAGLTCTLSWGDFPVVPLGTWKFEKNVKPDLGDDKAMKAAAESWGID